MHGIANTYCKLIQSALRNKSHPNEFSLFDLDLTKSLDFIAMETNAINSLNDRLHRMTSQDYSTNCVSDEPGGDEDCFNQSESETELQSQSVGEPIEKLQNPKATCDVTDQNPSVESPVPSLQTTPPTSSFKETPHTNSDELYPAPTSNMRPDAQEEPNLDEAVVSIAGDRAYLELDSVAVDWVHWRLGKRCNVCKRDFDYMSIGTHCRRCGQLYCSRCIPQKLVLRGHGGHDSASKPVPVCLICVKALIILGEVSGNQVDSPHRPAAENQ